MISLRAQASYNSGKVPFKNKLYADYTVKSGKMKNKKYGKYAIRSERYWRKDPKHLAWNYLHGRLDT